jgi:hypothetical protein
MGPEMTCSAGGAQLGRYLELTAETLEASDAGHRGLDPAPAVLTTVRARLFVPRRTDQSLPNLWWQFAGVSAPDS